MPLGPQRPGVERRAKCYDLDVDGFPDADSGALAYEAAFPVAGAEVVCSNNCTGYELTRSLDFDDAASYASGAVNPEWQTSGVGWQPIESFSTTFDGNGNTISNLFIERTGSYAKSVGLFSVLWSSAIRSIGLVDINVTASVSGNYVGIGGLVGRNSGTISDSYVTGSVNGTLTGVNRSVVGVGGLVGVNSFGHIMDSYATGRVSGTLTSTRAGAWIGGVGGLVGSNVRGNIGDSHVASSVVGSGAEGIGGLVGGHSNSGIISNSHAAGSVEGSQAQGVGGLVGHYSSGRISNSHATTSVTGNVIRVTTSYGTVLYGGVGGLVGYIDASRSYTSGSISNSHATGNVEGSGDGGVGGLVGYINTSGNISQSYATGSVSGTSIFSVGGLVGRNSGNISQSYASGSVVGSGYRDLGGLVGSHVRGSIRYTSGSISNSHASGSVVGSQSVGFAAVGGLAGGNDATISHSYATGSVTGPGSLHVGGLVGRNRGDISDSHATGRVTSPTSRFIGGLVGVNSDTISDSYATGSVEGSGSSGVGGLVGYANYDTISDSYATGNVEGLLESWCVGGLVGQHSGRTTSASYATGSVTGNLEAHKAGGVGGLVGCINRATISESYSIGRVSGTNALGALAGRNNRGYISSSFWDTEASGQPTGSGVGIGSSAGLLGRTTAQLQAPIGYTGLYRNWGDDVDRWDFGTSSQYPVLKVDFDGDGTATWQEFGSQRGDVPALPGAPTDLTATPNGPTQIDLSWSAPVSDGGAAITGYRIEVSANGLAWNDLEADTGSVSTSYSHTGLTAGTTRHYWVSAVNSAGTGAASTVDSATTTSDQAGTVTLSTMRPVVGAELTATLSDPDGGVTDVTWHWAKSLDGTTSWADIAGATSMSYTTTSIDAGYYLRATATYTDPLASGKTARGVSDYAVTEGDPLVARYDTNGNGTIEKNEVIAAINDYLFGEGDQAISKSDVIKLINDYLFG